MQTKLLDFSVDLKDGGNTFRAIANRAGVVDRGSDKTMAGAFAADLAERGPYRPLLWSHKTDEILGYVELTDGPKGLVVKQGVVNEDVQRGREALSLLKMKPGPFMGGGSGLSIGYATVREKFVGAVRELHELKIFEVSLVMLPMNQDSLVTDVDKASLVDLAKQLRRLNDEIRGDSETATPEQIKNIFASCQTATADEIRAIFRR